MTHTVTWRCPWCGQQHASILGSKFRYRREGDRMVRRRKCAQCIKAETDD